jgi:RNA polymerase sigma-70 factor (sigma-E family)
VGEPDGFREFVLARSGQLRALAWMLTGDAGLAEDLLQSALAKVWPHWSKIWPDGDAYAYTRRVMVTTSIAWWRRGWRRETSTGSLPEGPVRGTATDIVDDRDQLRRGLDLLPRRQRAVVVLRYYADLSESDTARTLGCSVGTVKSQAAKGLAKLRAALASDEPVGGPR